MTTEPIALSPAEVEHLRARRVEILMLDEVGTTDERDEELAAIEDALLSVGVRL